MHEIQFKRLSRRANADGITLQGIALPSHCTMIDVFRTSTDLDIYCDEGNDIDGRRI